MPSYNIYDMPSIPLTLRQPWFSLAGLGAQSIDGGAVRFLFGAPMSWGCDLLDLKLIYSLWVSSQGLANLHACAFVQLAGLLHIGFVCWLL